MNDLRGPLRGIQVTQASGAGGNITCALRPPEGEVWDVYAIAASHDDVARSIEWQDADTDTALSMTLYSEAAVTARHYFFRDVGMCAPVRINHNCYLQYYIAAMAGAKTITMNALVERMVGVPTWKGT
jgi:hypothetical protein